VNFSEIIDYSVYLLRDPNNGIWTTTELKRYVNEGKDDLARDTKYLEDYRDYALINGTAIYDVDDDVVEIERVEFNGRHILPLSPTELSQYDSDWMNETGVIRRWYPHGSTKIGYFKKPTWTAEYSAFSSEYGVVIDMEYTGDTYTFSDEYGIIVDIEASRVGDGYYFTPDDSWGTVTVIDENALCIGHRVVYTPPDLVNNTDVPELPSDLHMSLVFYACWRALDRDSPARKQELADFYKYLYLDCKQILFTMYNKAFRSEDRNLSIRPLTRKNQYRYYVTGRN